MKRRYIRKLSSAPPPKPPTPEGLCGGCMYLNGDFCNLHHRQTYTRCSEYVANMVTLPNGERVQVWAAAARETTPPNPVIAIEARQEAVTQNTSHGEIIVHHHRDGSYAHRRVCMTHGTHEPLFVCPMYGEAIIRNIAEADPEFVNEATANGFYYQQYANLLFGEPDPLENTVSSDLRRFPGSPHLCAYRNHVRTLRMARRFSQLTP